MKTYLDSEKEPYFNVNYSMLANNLNGKIVLKPTLMKTYLFAYKPCEDLMKLVKYQTYYNWLSGLKNKSYFEVVEGTQEIRPVNKNQPVDVNNSATYITKEKGTDINMATYMLSKGFQNAYDVAILISGDTDYIPVVKELHQLGKIVVLASLPTQNISKFDEYVDAKILMNVAFLKKCINVK